MNKTQLFTNILEELSKQADRKHDIHYKDGSGALIVPQGYPLKREYVIASISEMQIQMMMLNGSRINIKF